VPKAAHDPAAGIGTPRAPGRRADATPLRVHPFALVIDIATNQGAPPVERRGGSELCRVSPPLLRQAPCELFVLLADIEHRTTRVKQPPSNGIVERFHRTLLDEHFRVEGRKT
jgi:hypothetical protein